MKIDENAGMEAVEQACPGLNYILVLHNPETTEIVQVSNMPPEIQKKALEHNLKAMEHAEPDMIPAPQIPKH